MLAWRQQGTERASHGRSRSVPLPRARFRSRSVPPPRAFSRVRRHVRVFVRKRRCHACAAHALHPPGRARTSHASHMRAQLKGRAWPVHAPRMYEHSCKAERGPYMHRACANTAVRQSAACTCIAQVRTQLQGRARPVHASRMYEHSCKAERGLCMHRACTNTAVRQSMACTCIAHVRTQLQGRAWPVHASR